MSSTSVNCFESPSNIGDKECFSCWQSPEPVFTDSCKTTHQDIAQSRGLEKGTGVSFSRSLTSIQTGLLPQRPVIQIGPYTAVDQVPLP